MASNGWYPKREPQWQKSLQYTTITHIYAIKNQHRIINASQKCIYVYMSVLHSAYLDMTKRFSGSSKYGCSTWAYCSAPRDEVMLPTMIGTTMQSGEPVRMVTATKGRCISIECSSSSMRCEVTSKSPVASSTSLVTSSTGSSPSGVSTAEAPDMEHLRRPTWWDGPRMNTRLGEQ